MHEMEDVTIFRAISESEFDEACGLFQEYADNLGVDLCFQNFEQELENIRDIYGPPGGCLLLARRNDSIVGCVAFRRFNDAVCEMKRLYVKQTARGVNVGRELAVELIRRARSAGYRRMVLDTLPHLKAAQALYRSLGFQEIKPYYVNPLQGAVYMELELVEETA